MAWRKAAPGPAAGAWTELAGYAEEYAAAADRGEPGAAERLRAVESWLDMVRAGGGDPEVAELFVGFARDDRMMAGLRVRGGVA